MFSARLLLSISVASILAINSGAIAGTPDSSSCDVWQAACHYTSSNRESTYDINRVVIHKTEGARAADGASWFANCSSGGSAHYVLDKSNGYCYQSVREKDVAWHAGWTATNNNSIGIEHSGWTANNDTATACYDESAIITRSAIAYYGVPCNRSYIIGHSEVPGCANPGGGGTTCHTDPGPYWDWTYYINKCGATIPPNPPYTFTASTEGWTVGNAGTLSWNASGWLDFNPTGNDSSIVSPATDFYGGNDQIAYVCVYPSGGASWNHDMQLFWKTSDSPSWSEDKSSGIVAFQAVNGWIDVFFDLRSSTYTNKKVTQFRLDFDNTDGGTEFYVDKFFIYDFPCPNWTFPSDAQGWSYINNGGFSSFGWNNGQIVAQQRGNDAGMTISTVFNGLADQHLWVRVFPQGGSSSNHTMQAFWKTTDNSSWSESYSSGIVAYQVANGWIDVYLPLANNWAGKTITALRVDVDDANVGTKWYIDRVSVMGNAPRWDFPTDVQNWTYINNGGLTSFGWNNSQIVAQQGANDAGIWCSVMLNGLSGQSMKVRIFPQGGNSSSHTMQAFWKTTDNSSWSESYSSGIVSYTGNNGWFDITLPLTSNWAGKTVTALRLDFDDANHNTKWYVDSVFVKN